MKIKLTKSELIDLHNVFDCEEWKENIEEILSENLLTPDNQLIEIDEKYINLVKSEGTKEQKYYLFIVYNIDLIEIDITQFRKLFYEIMEGLTFHKTTNGYQLINSKKEFIFAFDFKINHFLYSNSRVYKILKQNYNYEEINKLLKIIVEEDFKLFNFIPFISFMFD